MAIMPRPARFNLAQPALGRVWVWLLAQPVMFDLLKYIYLK